MTGTKNVQISEENGIAWAFLQIVVRNMALNIWNLWYGSLKSDLWVFVCLAHVVA